MLKRIRSKIASRSAGSSLPRLTARSVDCSTWARPRATASSLISTAVTDRPARASTSAMPAPMVPSPTTPTSFSSLATLPLLQVRRSWAVSHSRRADGPSGVTGR